MTIGEIEELVEAWGKAARRAKEAGFDAVEIHNAHGYLLSEFLSSRANKRTDRYGGNLDGRSRFSVEVVKQIKKETGDDYPVIVRINGSDYLPDGLTLDESLIVCRKLEEEGADSLDVSAGTHEASQP